MSCLGHRMPKLEFFCRAAAIVLFVNTFRCVVNAPGHLMDLNFSFDHSFIIRRFGGTLRRDLIEDSFLFEANCKKQMFNF